MSSKVKVNVSLPALKSINEKLKSRRIKKQVGEFLIKEVKDFISKGISPVKGYGRFPAYKDPDRYPGGQKSNRPVNLRLSGDMLSALKFKYLKNSRLSIGWFPGLFGGKKEAKKAQAHNDGTLGSLKNAKAFKKRQIKKLIGKKISNKKFDSSIKKINKDTAKFSDAGIPQRKILPNKSGEDFNVSIKRNLRNLYAEIIYDIIKRNR